MQTIKVNFSNLKYIYHIGDIHIRNLQRHDEYRLVFEKFYKSITEKENSIILIAGDIAHAKTDMSPELVREVSEFLKECSNILPTILITGNHDCNLNNKSRLDVLTPIVENIPNENLHYLRDSGLYKVADTLFSVMSVFDDPTTYIKHKDISSGILNKIDKTIALFHGPINNAKTDIGYVVSNRAVTSETFSGYDYVLCGDIHKHQIVNEKNPLIVYCGSLVQQNFGEDIAGHGYLFWNLETKSFVFNELKNDYGYVTGSIKDDKLFLDLNSVPEKGRLRLKISNSEPTKVKEIVNEIRKKFTNLTDVIYVREVFGDLKIGNRSSSLNLENVSDFNVQNKLIKDYLERTFVEMDKDTISDVQKINEDLNSKLDKTTIPKSVTWIPKTFKFDNMFSFGEGNIIDFTKTKNVIGVFAPNASGKSSSFEALCFCLFDKCSKAFKASHILNTNKISMMCEFNFEINGVNYFIKRKGSRNKKGDVKIEVEFYKIENDKKISLNGEERRGTNDVIRDYVGSYEDFILTTFSIQNNNSNFIDKGQSERKDLLAQFLGLNIFDRLYNSALEEHREISTLMRNFNRNDFTKNLSDIEITLENKHSHYSELLSEKENIESMIAEVNSKIFHETSQIINLSDVGDDDISVLEKTKNILSEKLKEMTESFKIYSFKLESIKNIKEELSLKLNSYDIVDIKGKCKEYENIVNEIQKIDIEFSESKVRISTKLEKLKHLDEHEYDPNCIFCMNNVFVKDAIQTRHDLEDDKITVVKMKKTKSDLQKKMEELEVFIRKLEEYNNINEELTLKNNDYNNIISQIESLKTKGRMEKQNLDIVLNKIELYYKSIEIIEQNKIIKETIKNLKIELTDLNRKFSIVNTKILDINGEIKVLENKKEHIVSTIEEVKGLENKNSALQYYIDSIKRDGIPYEIICKSLPILEQEINNILANIVDFTIHLDTDGKCINANIICDDSVWPLDLGSGMEKFISSLAIRIALTNISNLPRPQFLILDEGLGCLDSQHMSTMHNIFSYLKTKFEFIILISHIDSTKDMVDSQIEIKKENGFSKLVYI